MKVEGDPEACIGCGLCVRLCSEAFGMDFEEGISKPRGDKVPPDSEKCARTAAKDCPTGAISVK